MSITSTRKELKDLLVFRSDWTLCLWTGDSETDGSPILLPCELPRNFQEKVHAPVVKKRRRTPSAETSESEHDEGSTTTNATNPAKPAEGNVFRSPSRSSRVVGLTDPVGSRVSMVLSDGVVMRADLEFAGKESNTIRKLLGTLAWALPSRIFAMFWHRFLKLQYGPAHKPEGAEGEPQMASIAAWPADWENFLVAFFSFCHPLAAAVGKQRSGSGSAARAAEGPWDNSDLAWELLLASDMHSTLKDDPVFRKLSQPARTESSGFGRLSYLFEISKDLHLQHHTEPGFRDAYGPLLAALHLTYEDLKLNVLTQLDIKRLAQLLFQLAFATGSIDFADHYRRDGLAPEVVLDLHPTSAAPLGVPPDIYRWVHEAVSNGVAPLYPTLSSLRQIYLPEFAADLVPHGGEGLTNTEQVCSIYRALIQRGAQAAVFAMVDRGISAETLDCWPDGVALPLREALRVCRADPPTGWHKEAYFLLGGLHL